MTGERLQAGDWIRLRLAGSSDEWCPAAVVVASGAQPQSVALELTGVVRAGGGVAGGILPATVDYERETVTSLFGDEYEVEV